MTGPVHGASGKARRSRDDTERHFDRLYARLDEVHARVGRLEKALWMASGSLGSVALFNLWSNLSGGS